jgi:hypothetical protein
MALKPKDEVHAKQIQAGQLGRRRGHEFEDQLTKTINDLSLPHAVPDDAKATHIFSGEPALHLIEYICRREGIRALKKVTALSTGALATSEDGKHLLTHKGIDIKRCKSDVLLVLHSEGGMQITVGVSVKQCNTKSPTNAQVFCSTAAGFAKLLRDNGIPLSPAAEISLKRFCGEEGHTPSEDKELAKDRKIDPRRYFWEELPAEERLELSSVLRDKHDEIFRLLLEKAYSEDTFPPTYVLHKTKKTVSGQPSEVAIFAIDELISQSRRYRGFETKEYRIRKGSFRDPDGYTHHAPRFGIIQMQRLGNKQNATQLQFNLEAGYFYALAKKLEQAITDGEGK